MSKSKIKINESCIWSIARYVRWANEETQRNGRVSDYTKQCVMYYVRAMFSCGIKVDRKRIYETNYLTNLVRDYIKEN